MKSKPIESSSLVNAEEHGKSLYARAMVVKLLLSVHNVLFCQLGNHFDQSTGLSIHTLGLPLANPTFLLHGF